MDISYCFSKKTLFRLPFVFLATLFCVFLITFYPKNIEVTTLMKEKSHLPQRTQKSETFLDKVEREKLYMHYIRFKPDDGKTMFRFTDYLSVMSAVQYLKPDGIFVHGDFEPTGNYWEVLRDNGLVRHIHKNITNFVGRRQGKNKKIGYKEHSADISKLDVLLEYGGVVADFDVFFIRGERIKQILQRKKAMTCYGDRDGYNIGLVAAKKDSKFVWAWRRSYQDIYVPDWNFQQGFVNKYLSILFSDEVYVVNWVCNNPHPDRNLNQYFHDHGKINWINSVAIHSYERFGGVPILKPDDLYTKPLTTHKELLLTIYENRTLPPFDETFVDELNPLIDD